MRLELRSPESFCPPLPTYGRQELKELTGEFIREILASWLRCDCSWKEHACFEPWKSHSYFFSREHERVPLRVSGSLWSRAVTDSVLTGHRSRDNYLCRPLSNHLSKVVSLYDYCQFINNDTHSTPVLRNCSLHSVLWASKRNHLRR